VATRFMGLKAEGVKALTMAVERGGTISPHRIEVAGDALEPRSFAVLDHFSHLRG
jgi:hypothetical protein